MSSSNRKSPAFQFYPDDFLGSGKVGTMTAAEVGVYVLLLCLDWNENGFQNDPVKLARWCRMSARKFAALWPAVAPCFVERDGRMYNPRLDMEREKQREWREKSALGGRRSGVTRSKGGSRVVEPPYEPNTQPNTNTPSPSPSPTPVTTKESSRSRAKREPGKYPHFPTDACNALYEHYVATVGAVDYARFRRAFAPLYPATGPLYTTAQLTAAITEALEDAQLEADGGNGYALRNLNPETIAGRASYWVEYAAEPLERDGVPTPKALRILSGGRRVA